jgi:hypothetical protein
VEAELIHADGQPDKTKLTGTFHEYVNVPKKVIRQYQKKIIPITSQRTKHFSQRIRVSKSERRGPIGKIERDSRTE